MARSKVKSRSYYDVAHQHPLTTVSQCLQQSSTFYPLWFIRYSVENVLLKLAHPFGRETAQLPSLTPCVTTIPAQHKTTHITISMMQNVQFCRQQANGNHMSAQHYSIEYREGVKCIYPF